MTTLYTMITVPHVEVTPDWMREERYMYCDQFYQDTHSSNNSSFWKKIKKFFS